MGAGPNNYCTILAVNIKGNLCGIWLKAGTHYSTMLRATPTQHCCVQQHCVETTVTLFNKVARNKPRLLLHVQQWIVTAVVLLYIAGVIVATILKRSANRRIVVCMDN